MPTTAAQRKELLSGAGVLLGGLVLLIAAFRIDEPARSSPGLGPSVLPIVVSSGLILCGIILAVAALRHRDTAPSIEAELLGEDEAVEEALAELEDPEPIPWRSLLVIMAMMVGYAMIFVPLGFILSTTLFLTAVTTFVHPAKWLRNVLFAALLSAGVFYLFRDALSVILPAGILG